MEQLNNNEYNILVVEDYRERTNSSGNCGYHDAADGWRDHDDQIERTS